MKKISVLIIAMLYLAVTSGLLVQIHHCMGRVTGVSMVASQEHTCSTCGMTKGANACCKDELKRVKLQDDHQLKYTCFSIAVPECTVHQHNLITNDIYRNNIARILPGNHSPPRHSGISLSILYGVFRI